MPLPKISIIVPVYNADKYLRRCVDSILAQTFTDFELLLIDDGSNDCSGVICDEYAVNDSRVRVFHKPNGGVSSARNVGLDNARGEWITFCDADDFVSPWWLVYFNFDNTNGYNIICQGLNIRTHFQECVTPIGFEYRGNIQIGLYKLFENGILGYLFIKAFRGVLIKQRHVRFDESIRYREDEKFLLDYVRHDDIMRSIDKRGYTYMAPNWSEKYRDDVTCKFCSQQYKRIKDLKFSADNDFRRYFVEEFKMTILKECVNAGDNQDLRILYLKRLVIENRDSIRLSSPIKIILTLNIPTCVVRFMLINYMKLRHLIKSKLSI